MFKKVVMGLCMLLFVLSVPILAAENAPAVPAAEKISLDKCLEMSYQNSQALKAAMKNTEMAKESVKQAQATLGPSVDYSFTAIGYSEKQTVASVPYLDPASPTGIGSTPVTSNQNYAAGIGATQPLDLSGRLHLVLKTAQAQLQTYQEEERKTKQQITYNVTDAYYRLWVAEQSLVVAKNSYENVGHHYQQVTHLYEVGTASKYDLLKAQVQWEGLYPAVIKAQNGVSLAKLALAIQIGYEKDRNFTVNYSADQLKVPEKSDFASASYINDAYANRPEMRQMKIAADIAAIQTRLAKAGYSPSTFVKLSYDGKGLEINPGDWSKTLSLTFNISGNLFNGGSTASKVRAAKENEDLIAIKESGLKDQIRLEVEQALQSVKESVESIKANQSNIGLAKESLRLTQARFDAGMATTMDIMDAQLALDQALNGYNQGIYNYLTAIAKLNQVLGK